MSREPTTDRANGAALVLPAPVSEEVWWKSKVLRDGRVGVEAMGVADVVDLHGQDPALVRKEIQPPGCPAGGPGRGGPGSRGYAWSAQPDRAAGRRYGRGGGESRVGGNYLRPGPSACGCPTCFARPETTRPYPRLSARRENSRQHHVPSARADRALGSNHPRLTAVVTRSCRGVPGFGGESSTYSTGMSCPGRRWRRLDVCSIKWTIALSLPGRAEPERSSRQLKAGAGWTYV